LVNSHQAQKLAYGLYEAMSASRAMRGRRLSPASPIAAGPKPSVKPYLPTIVSRIRAARSLMENGFWTKDTP
jgi:hypothetical protein